MSEISVETGTQKRVDTEPQQRLRVGVDLDEVLADLVSPLLDHHHRETGNRYHRDRIWSYNLWEVWGGTREEAIERVHRFYETDQFRNLEPMPGAVDAIETLGKDHELLVITSRPHVVEEHTHEWLGRHFPRAFSEIYMTNDWSRNGHRLTKAEVCDRVGVGVLIEDSIVYAKECAGPSRTVLLLDSPWNQEALPEHIVRAEDWGSIVDHVQAISDGKTNVGQLK